ncbi:MAG TPA: FkbM family methyltransferase [Acidobacteriaceae bacterium]
MNPWIIKTRSLARRLGVIRLINRFRPLGKYEQSVHDALADAVKPGDTVWDVGANVGVYSELFCQWVGTEGLVIAFEPWAESCDRIRERLPHCEWLQIENIALGEENASGRLVTAANSVENHIETNNDARNGAANSVPVTICRGDHLCNRLGAVPNVIKVDVEGFEEEVLSGMGEMLTSPVLRSVLVEVHFYKLELRGKRTAPTRIQKLLESKGFRAKWVDSSHLFATR